MSVRKRAEKQSGVNECKVKPKEHTPKKPHKARARKARNRDRRHASMMRTQLYQVLDVVLEVNVRNMRRDDSKVVREAM